MSGSLSFLKEDLDTLGDFADEDEMEIFVHLQAAMAAPKNYFGVFVPRVRLMGLDQALGGDGALIETVQWEAGVKTAATGYDGTLISMVTAA